jgi:hypothetical protein
MQVYVIEGEDMPKSKRAKVLREKPPTDWQRRCWCIGISMQMQKEPEVPTMLRSAQMIEDYILGKGAPRASNVTALPAPVVQ